MPKPYRTQNLKMFGAIIGDRGIPMWIGEYEGLFYADLIKTALLNGYGADLVDLGMDSEIEMTHFENFLSKVEDTELRRIFSEIGRLFL